MFEFLSINLRVIPIQLSPLLWSPWETEVRAGKMSLKISQ